MIITPSTRAFLCHSVTTRNAAWKKAIAEFRDDVKKTNLMIEEMVSGRHILMYDPHKDEFTPVTANPHYFQGKLSEKGRKCLVEQWKSVKITQLLSKLYPELSNAKTGTIPDEEQGLSYIGGLLYTKAHRHPLQLESDSLGKFFDRIDSLKSYQEKMQKPERQAKVQRLQQLKQEKESLQKKIESELEVFKSALQKKAQQRLKAADETKKRLIRNDLETLKQEIAALPELSLEGVEIRESLIRLVEALIRYKEDQQNNNCYTLMCALDLALFAEYGFPDLAPSKLTAFIDGHLNNPGSHLEQKIELQEFFRELSLLFGAYSICQPASQLREHHLALKRMEQERDQLQKIPFEREERWCPDSSEELVTFAKKLYAVACGSSKETVDPAIDLMRRLLSEERVEVSSAHEVSWTHAGMVKFSSFQEALRCYMATFDYRSLDSRLDILVPAFVVNPGHPLIKALPKMYEKDPTLAKEMAKELYQLAILYTGKSEINIYDFVHRTFQLLEKLVAKLS